jgi:DNA-binding transcriptional regulator YiaG
MTGTEFTAIRARSGLSIAALAKLIGVTSRTVCRCASGESPVSKPIALLMMMVDRDISQKLGKA